MLILHHFGADVLTWTLILTINLLILLTPNIMLKLDPKLSWTINFTSVSCKPNYLLLYGLIAYHNGMLLYALSNLRSNKVHNISDILYVHMLNWTEPWMNHDCLQGITIFLSILLGSGYEKYFTRVIAQCISLINAKDFLSHIMWRYVLIV